MDILLMGPPGAGKGTQGAILSEALGLPKFATGDLLRDAVRRGTPLGIKAKETMEAGHLVSDDLILGVIGDEVGKAEAANGVIFDGVVRTIPQAEGMASLLAGRGRRIDYVLFFDVTDEEILGRLDRRRTVEGRADDDPESVATRLRAYRAQTAPVLEWYGARGGVTRIDAVGTVDDIAARVRGALGHVVITLKSRREIDTMARAGKIVHDTLELMRQIIQPGMSTEDLDREAERFIRSHPGATPSFKGLYGFPKTLCTSVDEEIVHGIPSVKKVLREGSVVSVDVGVCVDGLHADAASTIPVGPVAPDVERLLSVTQQSLAAGIAAAVLGNHVGDIGHAVQTVAESAGYGVVRELVGHGIGERFHEEPQVPNFGVPKRGPALREGMTLAIEPMITMGKPATKTLRDKWTVVTVDGSLAAHFEHTIAVTAAGPRILT